MDRHLADELHDYQQDQARRERELEENPIYKCDCCGKRFNEGVKIWDEKFCIECDNEETILEWYTSQSEDFIPSVVLEYIQSKEPIEA